MKPPLIRFALICLTLTVARPLFGEEVERVSKVEGQPLAANVTRVVESLEFLGAPLPKELIAQLDQAGRARDAGQLQKLLDPQVAFVVTINPEVRVKVQRGPAKT